MMPVLISRATVVSRISNDNRFSDSSRSHSSGVRRSLTSRNVSSHPPDEYENWKTDHVGSDAQKQDHLKALPWVVIVQISQ
jgi:hypothetical protein